MLPGEKTDYRQRSRHYTESKLLIGEHHDASKQWGNSFHVITENNENCIWSKTGVFPTAVGHERIYFRKKKNECKRKK